MKVIVYTILITICVGQVFLTNTPRELRRRRQVSPVVDGSDVTTVSGDTWSEWREWREWSRWYNEWEEWNKQETWHEWNDSSGANPAFIGRSIGVVIAVFVASLTVVIPIIIICKAKHKQRRRPGRGHLHGSSGDSTDGQITSSQTGAPQETANPRYGVSQGVSDRPIHQSPIADTAPPPYNEAIDSDVYIRPMRNDHLVKSNSVYQISSQCPVNTSYHDNIAYEQDVDLSSEEPPPYDPQMVTYTPGVQTHMDTESHYRANQDEPELPCARGEGGGNENSNHSVDRTGNSQSHEQFV